MRMFESGQGQKYLREMRIIVENAVHYRVKIQLNKKTK